MSWAVADAFDYKGDPADRSKTGGWVPAALILGIYALASMIFSSCMIYAYIFTLVLYYFLRFVLLNMGLGRTHHKERVHFTTQRRFHLKTIWQ